MKKLILAVVFICMVTTASCGGSSSGGGGGGGGALGTARTAILYALVRDGTQFPTVVAALLNYLSGQCVLSGGAPIPMILSDSCPQGGTWTLTATATCSVTATTLTIDTVTDSSLELASCASQVTTVDVDGDGTDDTTNVTLTGTLDPFEFADGTTVTIDDPAAPTQAVIDGTATAVYNLMALGGDITATLSFVLETTLANFDLTQGTGTQTCSSEGVTAIEGGQQGFCTIQSDCDCG